MIRRGFLAIMMALALVGCDDDNPLEPEDPNVVTFTAQLSAANEVPPITNAESTARGDARIVFNLTRDAGNNITGATVNFTVNLNSFPAGSTWTLAHIHEGNAGVAGGVRVNTGLTPGTAVALTGGGVQNHQFTNITVTDATLVNNIVINPAGYYFNVHTALNGGGAVRGQLVRQ
jgi:hypothetical protein